MSNDENIEKLAYPINLLRKIGVTSDIGKELIKCLEAAIDLLDSKQQYVLLSHIRDNQSFRDIGYNIGLYPKRIISIHNTALGILRKQYPEVLMDDLYHLLYDDDGLLLTFRNDNRLDEEKYNKVKEIIIGFISLWKTKNVIPKKAFLMILELNDTLVGGSRFLNDEETIRVEDASIEIYSLLQDLWQ